MSDDPRDLGELSNDVKASWQRFLDVFEPLRPELYRYCRYLTRSPWDAEDLVQDTMARGFVTLGTLFHEVPNPRAWLFRVASNLWIDRARRQRLERDAIGEPAAAAPAPGQALDERASREAAGTLVAHLSPQERAAVVLKDVFDLSLEEVAASLSTSVGAVKAALHRGRGKLVAPEADEPRAPAPGVLDAFCAAFNAGDLQALTSLLLDSSITEIVGVVTEYGREPPADPRTGSFVGSLSSITTTDAGGVDARHLAGYLGGPPRCEVREHRGELLLLFWFDHDTGPAVRTVWTVETDGEHIARIRNYFFTPDVIAEICRELAVPFRTNGYRYWIHG
ncbi:RNA polymerase sigma factor [Sorangium atrum]|uniref:RNA polymerase sigma factor n=1 Tax=Sorangium atrum TaxID=2995308 RepID=A0ABT5BX58_9BACT|nr:RNA polymerase sigma factor [Sorangium aterium]MDC0678751.1 RNA polymerase sigma factor [Sorangium aterium]